MGATSIYHWCNKATHHCWDRPINQLGEAGGAYYCAYPAMMGSQSESDKARASLDVEWCGYLILVTDGEEVQPMLLRQARVNQ